VEEAGSGALRVHGLNAEQVATAAAAHGVPLYEITPERPTLEKAFLHLTKESR
jgi:ABC-2 type transport system ATP-binding protein